MFFTNSRQWLNGLSHSSKSSRLGPRRRPARRLLVEVLEERTLPSLIPSPVVTGNGDVSASLFSLGNHNTPSVAIDPVNPQDLVTVYTRNDPKNLPAANPVIVEAGYSTDGGQTWTAISLPGNLIDPTSNPNNPAVFPYDTDPSVAFDNNDNVFIIYAERRTDNSVGAIVLQKFNFPAGGTPTQTISNGVINEWTQDPAFTPMVAVDTSTSPFANNVYVTWSTKDVAPTGAQNFNANSIEVVVSSDGGNTFSAPTLVNSNGHFGSEHDAVPQLAISGGTADGRVPAGQVNLVYEDFNSGANIQPPGVPLGFINYSSVSAGVAAVFSAAGGNIKDAAAGTPNVPAVTDFTQTVNITDSRFVSLSKLTVTINMVQPNLSEIQIRLIGPGNVPAVILLRNRTDAAGNNNNNVGTAGANLGTGSISMGTVFDQDAARSINNTISGAAAPFVGHFIPDGGDLTTLDGLTPASLNGVWTLEVTDFRNDGNQKPIPSLTNWTLDFTSGLAAGAEQTVASTAVLGALTSPFPLGTASNPRGVGPAPVIASDNTTGANSPYRGRLYIAYVDREVVPQGFTGPSDNTNIELVTSDNGGASWSAPVQVNDDLGVRDGFSGAGFSAAGKTDVGRPQYQPDVAVDQSTGTLVVSWYDARNDPSVARVARYVTTSIDGGQSFSPDVFMNKPETATDEITGKTVVLGPIPDNISSGNPQADSTFGFGDRQGMAVADGHIVAVWSGNLNGGFDSKNLLDILSATATFAAGPRIISSTQGPVAAGINNTLAADGTRLADTFDVTFDRPVDPTSFTTNQVTVIFRDAHGDAGVSLNIVSVTALDSGPFGPANASGATQFQVGFDPSLAFSTDGTYVGTYSYAVGPNIQSLIGSAPSLMDQDANGTAGENPSDDYAAPRPLNGGPFQAPYDLTTEPLIVPGPHIVNSFVPGNPQTSDNLVLNGTVSFIDVTFDRDMNPSTFTADQVLRLMGPVGEIGPNGNFRASFSVTTDPQPGEDPNFPRTYRVNFLTPNGMQPISLNLSGTYTLVLGTGIQSKAGDSVDANLNAGLDILRQTPSAGTTPIVYSTSPAQTIGSGQTIDSTINITDNYLIQGITLSLNVTYPHDPDLQATLIGPNNTRVTLFSGIGANGTQMNFTNTVFDDAATVPIEGGTPPFTGRFNPLQPLDVFSGGVLSSQGNWTLEIKNTGTGSGTLNSWSLTLLQPLPLSGLGEPVADQESVSFRIFTMDPANPLSSSTWTSVGPGENSSGHGRIGGIAVDPSDPTGNTVYVAGASGGVWKTTDFLTDAPGGPTYIPLTDFGPTFGINIGGLAVFGRNNDTRQSVIFAATGEGDTGSEGVGFLRSMDGGATWTLLDSTTNVDANGNILPLNSSQRDHIFVGTHAFKVLVDPRPTPSGNVIIYAALTGTNGGVWRSTDTGKHWLHMRTGQATDIVFDPNSGHINTIDNPTGNLDVIYAAFEGDGVYVSPNRGQVWNELLGTTGDPLIQDGDNFPQRPIPVTAGTAPNGAEGRIVLAKPDLTGIFLPDGTYTGSPAQDLVYEGWLDVLVTAPSGHLFGLFVTKDYGQNWTKVHIPTVGTSQASVQNAIPTNDSTQADYDVFGGGQFTQGNYDTSMAVDPVNPNVLYLGGTTDGQPTGFIRVDITGLSDPHAFFLGNNKNGNQLRTLTSDPVALKNWPNGTTGQVGMFIDPFFNPYLNLIRDPFDIFNGNATILVSNTDHFANTGTGATWIPFDLGGTDQHRIVTIRDPLTGLGRIIIGDDQGIYSALDNNGSLNTGLAQGQSEGGGGAADRNGNLQIAQFYYGASQPSDAAAQIAGALFYSGVQDGASDVSDPNVLTNGNLTWGNNGVGDSGGIATDQTGSGTLYQYIWPCCGGDITNFFKVSGIGRTFGLVQQSGGSPVPDPQWPFTGGANFAVNPIDGDQIMISSFAGRVFGTADQGRTWFVIGDPAALDGSQSLAMAYGSPQPNDPTGALNDFLYVGTNAGHIFVTFTGGGANGNQWTNLSAGLDGSAVQKIVTNPTRGSREAYAVTLNGVYHMVDAGATGATWVNITGNLFQITHNLFTPFNDSTQLVGTQLAYLDALQADWRYAIPNSSGSGTHPFLYVGGEGGIYRSEDGGATWAIFPNAADDHSQQDGGFLPNAHVTDLNLAIGNIVTTTGKPLRTTSPDVLLASTYGRGSFAIKVAPVIVKNSLQLDPSSVSTPPNTTSTTQPLIDGMSELSPLGNDIKIELLDANGNSIGQDPNNPSQLFVYTDNTGRFQIQIQPGVLKADGSQDGSVTVYVRATDFAGTVGPQTAFTFNLKTLVPVIQKVFLDPNNPPPNGSDSGASIGHSGFTNVNQPFIAGLITQSGPLVVNLYDLTNGTMPPPLIGTGMSNPDGTFSIQVNAPFTTDGVKTIQVVAVHTPAGIPGNFSFTLITTPPPAPAAPQLLGDNGLHITNNPTPQFFGTVESNFKVILDVNGVEVDNGATFADAAGNYTAAVTPSNALANGTYSVTVAVVDFANNQSPFSPAFTMTEAPSVTAVGVTSSPNPSNLGDSVTFTATVSVISSPSSGTPTGTVNFIDGSTQIGSGTLATVGGQQQASFTTSILTVGSHNITADYTGATSFAPSMSSVLVQTVNGSPTTTALSAAPTSITYGQSVTFTATVAATIPAAGTPTGTVEFLAGTTVLGTGSLSNVGGLQQATFTTNVLSGTPSRESITAMYLGDTNFATSTSSAVTVTVAKASTTIATVNSSLNPSIYGQPVTLTTTVSPVAPASSTPTGTVTFLDGGTSLGTAMLSGGTASLTITTSLNAGTHSITASYGGDGNFNTSSTSSALTQTVSRASTTTTLSSAANPSVFGQSAVTATVVINAPGAAPPPGAVVFTVDGTALPAVTLDANGQATLAGTALSVGTHSISAAYTGTANLEASSSAALSQTVLIDNSAVMVTSSSNPSFFGQVVTFTTTVTAAAPGSGIPSGNVTITLDGKSTTMALNTSGQATLSAPGLSLGTHTVTVSYAGDNNFNPSSTATPLTQTVNQARTMITVTSSANPSLFGQSVTFMATISAVSPGAGIPTGTVAFMDGGALLGTRTISGGQASLSTAALSIGSHTITVSYGGDPNFSGSTGSLTQVVSKFNTTIVISSSRVVAVAGRPVTFTATVSSVVPASVTPTGTVAFFVNGSPLGTASLSAGTASLTVSFPNIGSVSITASYLGDASFTPSSTPVPLIQAIGSLNQAFVAQVYMDLLHRSVDAAGLAGWAGILDNGGSRADVVQGIEGSSEYRSDQVEAAYHLLLHRDADPSGLNSFVNFLSAGGTVEQMMASIIGSPEYFQNRGGGTNEGFLTALYQDVLNRAPDPTGHAYFLLLLQQFTPTSAVAADVLGSIEYKKDLIDSFYVEFLRRHADSSGLDSFVNLLQAGGRDELAILDIVASDEYFARL